MDREISLKFEMLHWVLRGSKLGWTMAWYHGPALFWGRLKVHNEVHLESYRICDVYEHN